VKLLLRSPPLVSQSRPAVQATVAIALAGLISAAATGARFALEGTLPPGYPFLTFFPAVIITSFLCGTAAGTLCAVLCGLAAWYWFIPPSGFALDRQSAFALAFYVFIVAVDIALIHLMTRAMRRLEAEKRVSNALVEQQRTMFEELQHRVANNMAFVASLLNMSHRRLKADPSAAPAILDEARNRIETMARIHRRLHDPNQVDLPVGAYLNDLCADVIEASGVSGVACDVDVPEMTLDIRKLTTLSMLVSEIVTNSLKHAFPDGRAGRIRVALRLVDDATAELTIADDGVGLPAHPEGALPGHGLGNRIVEALSRQLKGTVSRETGPGLTTRITFQR
jgi:two-component sensor histidine kinase